MKLRPPSVPLITVDPYFSVWSSADKLYEEDTVHWTGSPNTLKGYVIVDGVQKRFMGAGKSAVIEQIDFDMNAFVSRYTFADEKITLDINFYTPVFADDINRLSLPVSYVSFDYCSNDEDVHDVYVKISASEEFAVNKRGEEAVSAEAYSYKDLCIGKIGTKQQNILSCSGDDVRINWGYFYMASDNSGKVTITEDDGMVFAEAMLKLTEAESSYLIFAYDDIYALRYFGRNIKAYWKKFGKTIEEIMSDAIADAEKMREECYSRATVLELDSIIIGGEKYSDLTSLAYRQVMAAHKLALDEDDNVLFISKECFSNGCAATVDVTYPSSPMFIYYNTELLKGMLRPVFRFAESDEWEFDFAPHDVGQYPILDGQVYGKNHEAEGKYKDYQMPVEECGNMLIMLANISLCDKNTDFADCYMPVIEKWVKYLLEYGMDPENQLCTDDFAGHLAHNCNLSLKAIMGIAGYSLILDMKGEKKQAEEYMATAEKMADNWVKTAANTDGSFRLTFDRPDTFSMKYNMIWDKIWNTGLFAPSVYYAEFSSNKKHINPYGMPLDNRRTYTKSDWLLWTACLAPTQEEFEEFITPMWKCYNLTPSRVPMTDWYDTVTSLVVGFRHRTVQGGLFIKLMSEMDCFIKE